VLPAALAGLPLGAGVAAVAAGEGWLLAEAYGREEGGKRLWISSLFGWCDIISRVGLRIGMSAADGLMVNLLA
jgi:hypothetical protein